MIEQSICSFGKEMPGAVQCSYPTLIQDGCCWTAALAADLALGQAYHASWNRHTQHLTEQFGSVPGTQKTDPKAQIDQIKGRGEIPASEAHP
jgi:hypothetical protein